MKVRMLTTYLPVPCALRSHTDFFFGVVHIPLPLVWLGSIVLLFGVLFSQQIREDLVRAATSPK